ncbi:MAG: B12-binding domain-containing radical SAM protein [Alphaproteobacteria bacterium]|nr:B12-binding domain-containing radical SAM protein [Alphaproteobacteria bacterium]
MNILLFSMPDSFEHMPPIAIRMPNGALTSLAGNVDPHHRVAVADLLLVQNRVRETVERLVAEHQPDVVGLSVMTFQRKTAKGIIDLVRTRHPRARVVVGGYDPSLAPEAYTEERDGEVDFIVRGEGEITFRELLRALEAQRGYDHIAGLSYRCVDGFRHNPARGVSGLEDGEIRPPRRDVRVLGGYTLLGRQVDVIETSRGCTFDCSFCSIIEMRGRNFHTYSFERVLADIRDARDRGARSLFIVDDNITLNVRRFEALCQAIIDAGLNDLEYTVQATTSAIANHGERLARLMREAGFRYVFLGIENILEEDLQFLRAESKNRERENGLRSGNATLKAIEYLHRNKMVVVGGLIVGSPGDTRESVEANLEFARKYVDWPYIQHPTPYPGTPMTKDFRGRGLIINERLEEYDGTTAVVRTEHLSADEVEFLRWRAERWMKLRHMPAAFTHSPLFLLRNAPKMFAHTFRGSTIRSFLGLEDEREAFRRFRAIRRAERAYL